jgi:hypothetical protein
MVHTIVKFGKTHNEIHVQPMVVNKTLTIPNIQIKAYLV